MRPITLAAVMFVTVTCASVTSAQDRKAANLSAAPPNLLLLVHRDVQPSRASEQEKLEVNLSHACDRLEAPSFWINLQSLTGSHEALYFDPFDSFEHWEQSRADWSQFYSVHQDLSRLQDEINQIAGSEHKIFAVRRDDVGYLADTIDLSEMRFMRAIEIHLIPGHEGDFVEGLKIMADAYKKIQAETPWVVYQVDVGMAAPTFLIFMPLTSLAQNDGILAWQQGLPEAEGEAAGERLKQITRESHATTETNLYVVRPEKSHVSNEFADGDPNFWRPKTAPLLKPSNVRPSAP